MERDSGEYASDDHRCLAASPAHPERYKGKRRLLRECAERELAKETDYCGIVSGNTKADKVKDCNFAIFYGKLKNVPLIEQCPVNLECKAVHLLLLARIARDRPDRGGPLIRRLPDGWGARPGENRPAHIRNRGK